MARNDAPTVSPRIQYVAMSLVNEAVHETARIASVNGHQRPRQRSLMRRMKVIRPKREVAPSSRVRRRARMKMVHILGSCLSIAEDLELIIPQAGSARS